MRLLRSSKGAEVPYAREITQYVCKAQVVFNLLRAEAVEVIEVNDVIMSVEVTEATKVFITTYFLEINNLIARIPLF